MKTIILVARPWHRPSDWAHSLRDCSHSTSIWCDISVALRQLLPCYWLTLAVFLAAAACWFMSPSPEPFAPADKIKFHTSVQCQLPPPGVLILTPILIAYDDNDVPHADTSVASCNELHPKWMIIKLFCRRLKPHDQFKANHPKRSLHLHWSNCEWSASCE